jgi:hypothetical protein
MLSSLQGREPRAPALPIAHQKQPQRPVCQPTDLDLYHFLYLPVPNLYQFGFVLALFFRRSFIFSRLVALFCKKEIVFFALFSFCSLSKPIVRAPFARQR